jgi:prepilin-type N-terminal cleavage/methylation domain-containing protein
MKAHKLQFGLTLVEILVVAAIVAVLAGIVLTTLTRIDSQSKENLCLGTLETLNTALRQFRDYGYEYRVNTTGVTPATAAAMLDFYRSLTFPPDCNQYSEVDVKGEIDKLLDPTNTLVIDISPVAAEQYEPNDSGSAVMYFFLSQVPECRETLAGIDPKLLKNDHKNNENYWTITVVSIATSRSYPWLRVVDPWGLSLRYDYYANEKIEDPVHSWVQRKQTIRNFPLITSAGPDGIFGTNDDITNRDKTKGTKYVP